MISVITICRNAKLHIEDCIENVAEQVEGLQNIEHIIVDGASSDGTVEIIKTYAKKYRHIRYVSERDRGQSDAMNKGIKLARGDVISFLNVDDYYERGALKTVTESLSVCKSPFILVGNCRIVDGKRAELKIVRPSSRYWQILQLWKYTIPNNPSSYFYSKEIHNMVGYYDVKDHFAMDLGFLFRAYKVSNIYYVNEILGNYAYFPGTKTYDSETNGRAVSHIEYAQRSNNSRALGRLLVLGGRFYPLVGRAEKKSLKRMLKLAMLRFYLALLSAVVWLYAHICKRGLVEVQLKLNNLQDSP